jgi:hypothetical protein
MKHPSLVYLILCLWCWAPIAQLRAIPLSVFLGGSPPSAPSFTAYTAVFDGANDAVRYSGIANNVADGKTFTISFWINFDGSDGVTKHIWEISSTTAIKLYVWKDTDNKINVRGNSFGGTNRLQMGTTSTFTAASAGWDGDGWSHIFICADTTDAAKCKIYVNGSQEAVISVRDSSTNIDLAPDSDPRYAVGSSAGNTAGLRLNAALAELLFYDTYHDIPASFYNGTNPADIGATGSTPTGSAPDFYYSRNGQGEDWKTDSSGNGHTLSTVTGGLTATTAP